MPWRISRKTTFTQGKNSDGPGTLPCVMPLVIVLDWNRFLSIMAAAKEIES